MDRRQGYPRQYNSPQQRAPRRKPVRGPVRPRELPDGERSGWLRGTAKFCGLSLIPVVLLVLLSVGLLYFRLLQGPVSLNFLVKSVEQGINAELTGLDAAIDDIVVTLTDNGALEFRLENLQFSERDGDLVVAAPQAAMELNYAALWRLQATPSRVELIEPRLFLFYSEEAGLSLKFSPGGSAGLPSDLSDSIIAPSPVPARRSWPGADTVAAGAQPSGQTVDFTSIVELASERARRGGGATSYLREIGLRDATVVLDTGGQASVWRVPRFSVDMDHHDTRSIISGSARISSQGQIWTLSFRAEDVQDDKGISLTTSIRGLVPRWLGDALPQLAVLKHFDIPIASDGRIDFNQKGSVAGGEATVEIGEGRVDLAGFSEVPFTVDSGLFTFKYDATTERVILASSNLRWGDSSLTLGGTLAHVAQSEGSGEESGWRFDIAAEQGVLGATEFGIPPLPVDKWHAQGTVAPERGLLKFDRFEIAAGGGHVSLMGELATTGSSAGSHFEAEIGAMPIATMKVLWPRGMAEDARQWVGRRIHDGVLQSGTYRYLNGRYLAQADPDSQDTYRMSLASTLENVVMMPVEGTAPITLSRTLVKLENQALEVIVPDGSMPVSSDHVLGLKSGRFTIADVYGTPPVGEVAFATGGKVGAMLALLELPAFDHLRKPEALPDNISGEVASTVTLSFPLLKDLQAEDVRIKAKARLTDGRAEDLLGEYDLKGATINFDLSETAVDAQGEVLIEGVLAKLNWQRIFGATDAQQPPIRVTATLDEADRRQLGLDLGDGLHGDVAVEVTVQPHSNTQSDVRLRADLTNTDVAIEEIAWRKPTGRSAFLEFDVVKDASGRSELRNFRLEGDDLSIEGVIGLGQKKQVVSFSFPKFWLNLVTRLEVSGKLDSKNVWQIRAKGPTYDGRAFFRTLYSIPGARTQGERQKKQAGVDLTAEIDNVLGYGDVNLRGVKLKLSERNGQLSALDIKGKLSGGQALDVALRNDRSNGRQLLATSRDAGEAFKLVGFYPNMTQGSMRLEVNLDGRGPAQKTGILWVDNFQVLGDPVISEVAGSADATGPSIDGGRTAKRRMVRQVFQFDRMRAPFSVGYGQFVLEDAYLRGPLQGATVRGKVDYSRQMLELGGTYVPLQGLNNAFGAIPVLGELLSGPRQEGIFGVTYAIQGSMDNPQVVVHPLSMIAPGIFREMFQLTPQAPSVQPRQGRTGGGDYGAAVRSSSSPADAGRGGGNSPTKSGVDGWSSETSPAKN
ncbi:conserved protein of unknown function [Candidatus Filomicrobium marinum]|uniref:Uncharacterized protein n=2 Tax=Filomicrobium TaxID=119044 RepID=A0A0D6JAX2_9HYPH|nr:MULTISPECIES: AsmA-like C-terminal region-containing protein [Filomicrobium]CFX00760.1 conserved protein of unknown function [Candidatus Filomicrobium marinum]CPR15309.1 conserved protein of unknown function [Candidatus Filomicrobium marinum]SDO67286.1 AsmA-like C-terminal region [Filomicrobium insigne]